MLALISGGSASGKSAYAEDLASRLAASDAAERGRRAKRASEIRKIYLATMKNEGAEAAERIAKHRAARAGQGFLTAECPSIAADDLRWKEFGISERCLPGATILLEDLPNLLANGMFSGQIGMAWDLVGPAQALLKDDARAGLQRALMQAATMLCARFEMELASLWRSCGNLIVVTDEIFSDGGGHGAATDWYLRMLSALHGMLAEKADALVEVVYGIPLVHKGKELSCISGH